MYRIRKQLTSKEFSYEIKTINKKEMTKKGKRRRNKEEIDKIK